MLRLAQDLPKHRMMRTYFVLDESGEPRLEPDVDAWRRWFEQADRGIARTAVTPEITVLTTFRGVDEAADHGEPCLFETRIFGGALDGEEVVHRSRAEALAAHTKMAEWCRIGSAPDGGVSEDMLR